MRFDRKSTLEGVAESIELRFTPSGRAVCMVYIRTPTGDTVRAEAWDQVAEDIAEKSEGIPFTASGWMRRKEWTGRDDEKHGYDYLAIETWC